MLDDSKILGILLHVQQEIVASILIASSFHLPKINIFYGINCEPNEVGSSLLCMW